MNAGDITIQLTLDGKNMELGIKDAARHLRQFQNTVEQTSKSVNRLEAAQSSLGTKFRNLIITLGNLRFAVMDINDVFLRLPASILKTSGELERTQQLLTGLSDKMTDSARKAEGALNFSYITDMAKKAPFEISALSDSFVKLKSGGLDPAAGSLSTMVDTVAKFGGSAETLKRANVAIQQMLGKSVVSMEELRQQLGEAAPTAIKDMATGMGMSIAKLSKLISTGTVEASDALNKMMVVMRLRNYGAAEDMMNTWTGTLSQLKTEWELTAKFIAESGFGDAAKDVAKELATALASPDFKRFAGEVSQGLSTAVRWLADFTRGGIEMAGVIKNLAITWVAYKVAAGAVNAESIAGWKKSMEALSATQAEKIRKYNSEIGAAKAAAVASAAAEMDKLKAQRIANAQALGELATRLKSEETMLAAARARQAALMGGQANSFSPLSQRNKNAPSLQLNPIASVAAEGLGAAALGNARTAADAHASAVRRLSADISDHTNRQKSLAVEVANAGTKLRDAGAAAGAMSTAAMMASRAGTALGVAFNALGGWFTVVNLAIAGSVALLTSWESAASKAEKRARNISLRTTSKEDVEAERKVLNEIVTKREAAENEIARMRQAGDDTAKEGSARRAGYNRRVAELQNLLGEERGVRERYFKQVSIFEENQASADVARLSEESDRRLRQITQTAQQELSLLDGRTKERLAKVKAGSAEEAKILAEASAETKQLALRAAKDRLAFIETAQKPLQGRIDARSVGQLEELRKKADEARNDIINAQRAITGVNAAQTQKPEKGLSPIERLIADLKSQTAELGVEVGAYVGRLGEVESIAANAAGAAQRVRSRIANDLLDGKEDGKRVSPTAKQTELAAGLASQKATLEGRKRLIEQLNEMARDSSQTAEDAAERLADPLGILKQDKKVAAVRKLMAEIRANGVEILTESQKAAGITDKDIEDQLTGGFSTQRAAELLSDLESKTKEVNESLVDDNRLSARAIAEAHLESYRLRSEALVEQLRKDGVATKTLEQIQTALANNVAAQATAISKKYETPMQKMVSEWKNSTKNMEEATARWANGTIDAIVSMARTGKFEFKSLVESILADLLRIQLQKTMASAMSAGMDWLGQAIGSAIGGSFGGGSAPNASGGGQYDIVPKDFRFANSGVMTEFGSVPLRKYAAGGIARSPQLALFGEGDSAEAYVPLPDGRSIPVTMKGNAGGAPSVTVNVINQTSQEVEATQGQPRFDGQQMILDVVLSAAGRPGNFRNGLRNAVK